MPREDLIIKAEREALSKKKREVLKELEVLKSLRTSYEEVIDDLMKTLKWWKNNAWKATFVSLYNKLRKVVKL